MTWTLTEAERAAYEDDHGWTEERGCDRCGTRWYIEVERDGFDPEDELCDLCGDVGEPR